MKNNSNMGYTLLACTSVVCLMLLSAVHVYKEKSKLPLVTPSPIAMTNNPIYVSVNSPYGTVDLVKAINQHNEDTTTTQLKMLREKYLDLMKTVITGMNCLSAKELQESNPRKLDNAWTERLSLIGISGLRNIQELLENVISNDIPGDFLEAGVWRGGGSIFAKAVINSYNQSHDRKVWLCDSFQGLPKSTNKKDNDYFSSLKWIKISEDIVKQNFRRFSLLDDTVHFVKGWFVYSLPCIRNKIKHISVLRMDGDMYESLTDTFYNLYDLVPIGGYIIIDDWNIPEARKAVTEFRRMHQIESKLTVFRYNISAYWKVEKKVQLNMPWYTNFVNSRKLYRNEKLSTC
ncbi:unnamed protein product [Owenia fusiformis]|uniref:Uncharacterized protein n=1 Tax=Owenia fusiformis TaxID=6347 RepID=A0A8J1TGP0_OWEFU|nr:unnamed protein product [Owenia fusiformis]